MPLRSAQLGMGCIPLVYLRNSKSKRPKGMHAAADLTGQQIIWDNHSCRYHQKNFRNETALTAVEKELGKSIWRRQQTRYEKLTTDILSSGSLPGCQLLHGRCGLIHSRRVNRKAQRVWRKR